MTAAPAGFLFSLSLIVVIGPQNAFVLRQGALRQHVTAIVAICSLSDAALIAAGVAGAGAALAGRHWLLVAVRLGGSAWLLGYGVLALRRALRPTPPTGAPAPALGRQGRGVLAACLAFTWLNPAVYLDTVVLLGSVANAQPGHQWWFAAGAALASCAWFVALGFGSRALGHLLRRPLAWRAMDGLVAGVMALTALRLIAGS